MSLTPAQPVFVFAAQTSAGRVRTHNEDALMCCPELGLWAVADGMGGHQRGEVASALALQILRERIEQDDGLEVAVHAANQAIIAVGREGEGRSMGTTLVAVRMQGAAFELAWVGDSRAYRISGERIEQLSRDHSWVRMMVDAGS